MTSCRVVEAQPFVRLHEVSRRAVGDRALNRGQVSREDMRENYLRMREKCKCEWLTAAAMSMRVSRDLVRHVRPPVSVCLSVCPARSRAREGARMRLPRSIYR